MDYYRVLLGGSLGKNRYGEPVSYIISQGFKRSITLLIGAIIISIVFGILKGIFDSKRGKPQGSTLKLLTTVIGLSLPDFFVIVIVQAIITWIYVNFGIRTLPHSGFQELKHAILPTITLAIIPTMYIARITATSIDTIYGEEYVKTAIGKGLSNIRIIFVHVLRNVIVEIASSFSAIATMLLSSLIIVEYFYFYPGLTITMYSNYFRRDSQVVIGIAIIIGAIYISLDLIFRIIRHRLNPQGRQN